MRIRMISALCVVLSLIYSPRPAAAQVNPSVPPLPQATFGKLPLPAKLSEFQKGTESGQSRLHSELAKESANTLRSLRNLLIQREGASAMGMQSPMEGSRCAHMVIFQAPNVDSNMIIERPRELTSDMPTFAGLQACSGDFRREEVFLAVAPFDGSGRISTLVPSAGMQLDGRRSLFLPETPSRLRDKLSLPLVPATEGASTVTRNFSNSIKPNL
jgi:hypothetical protein